MHKVHKNDRIQFNAMIKRIFFLLSFSLLLSFHSFGQVGKAFWFVAPGLMHDHGVNPILFRITAFDKPAKVTISMPANSSFNNITVNVGVNQQYSYSLNTNVSENIPAGQVNNKGYLITSDQDVSVYYDVSDSYNPDKFILKGSSALGTRFYIPSQNHFKIADDHKGRAFEKVDIVATEDNTVVSFTPPVAVTGHVANKPVTIKLNRGQTYCIENRDPVAPSSMAGMLVTSTKEIAITISDDSVADNFPHDLIGDQLIPVSMLGLEYIAMRTNNDKGSKHKVYLLGTEDGTIVTINNDPTNQYVLNAGEQKMFDVTGNSIYIKVSSPIYAYQLTGTWNRDGNEFGSAILPSIVCTGSQKVSFTRTQTARFFIQILTQKKNRSGFKLSSNGTNYNNLLSNISWNEVPGTNNGDATWYTAIVQLNITTGRPYIIENTDGLFHLSVLDENGGSLSYGYFSSYSALRISIPSKVCAGDVVTLTAEGDLNNIKWYSDNTGDQVLGTEKTLEVTQSGVYKVVSTSTFGDCVLSATADVVFQQPQFDLGSDLLVCPGETVTLAIPTDQGAIKWHNNSTSEVFKQLVEANKTYNASVTVTNDLGCSKTDEVEIKALPAPSLSIGAKEMVCRGSVLEETSGWEKYQWVDGNQTADPKDNTNVYVPSHSGTYHLTAWNAEGCSTTKSIDVTLNELPSVALDDVTACDQQPHQFVASAGMKEYLWHDGTTASSLVMTHPGNVSVKVTDKNGCVNQDDAKLSWHAKPVFVEANDFSVCEGSAHTIVADNKLTNFSWFFDDGSVVKDLNVSTHQYEVVNAQKGTGGTFIIKAEDANSCPIEDRVVMTVLDKLPLDLGAKRDICEGNSVQLSGGDGFAFYEWTLGNTFLSNNKDISAKASGVYTLTATAVNGCKSVAGVTVEAHALPQLMLNDMAQQCSGTSFNLDVKKFDTTNGSSNLTYQWQTLVNGAWETPAGAEYQKVPLVVTGDGKKYRLTVTDDLGCSASQEVETQYFEPLNIHLNQDVSFCDNTTHQLQSPLTVGVDIQQYQWFKDAAGSTMHGTVNQPWNVTDAGTYVLEVVDMNGCKAVDFVQLKALPSPVFSIGADREICAGASTLLSIDGGATFSKYQWNNNPAENQPTKEVNSAGLYELKVWNKTGCSAIQSVNVSVNALPSVSLSDAITCANGSHTYTAQAGFNKYLWHDGSTQQSLTLNVPAEVKLTVTDAKGCENSATAKYEWYKETAFDKAGDIRLCEGSDYVIQADASLKDFQWFTEVGGVTTNLNNALPQFQLTNVQLTQNGTVFVIKANDDNGCSIEDRAELKVDVTKPLSLGADRTICRGDTIQLTGNHGFETYTWTSSKGEISHEPYVLVADPGIYKLEAIHFNGCSSNDQVTVSVHNQPTLTMTALPDQCKGTSFTISIDQFNQVNGPAVKYVWSAMTDAGWKVLEKDGTVPSFNVSESGVGPLYRVSAYDHLGCFANGEVQPKYHPEFDVALDNRIQTCDNTPFVLQSPYENGVDVQSYQWFKENVSSGISAPQNSNMTVNVAPNHQQYGKYMLSVVDLNGCSSEGYVDVEPFEALLLDVGPDRSFCDGTQIRIKDENGTIFEKYQWNGDAADNRSYKDVNQDGTYTLKVWDMNGCVDEKSVAVTKNSLPLVSLTDFTVCFNTPHTFTAPAGLKSYLWQDGSSNSTFKQSVPGEVKLTVTDNNGCQNSGSAKLKWFDVVDFKRIDDVSVCEGLPLQVNADIQLHDFRWSFNGADLGLSGRTLSLPQVVKGGSGEYAMTALDVNNCPVGDEFQLTVLEKAPLNLTPTHDICDGTSVMINGNQGFVKFEWTLNGTQFSNKPVIHANQSGTYRLVATHANSCLSEAATQVVVHDLPVLTMAPLSKECQGSNFTLAMQSFDTKNGKINPTYQWSSNNNGLWTNMLGGTSVVVSDVNLIYRLTATDDLGCSDSKELQPQYFDEFAFTLPKQQEYCDNTQFTLSSPLDVGVDVSGYRWYRNEAGNPSQGAENQPWVITTPGKYVLQVRDLNGCHAQASTEVKSLQSPVFSLGADRTICHGDPLSLELGNADQFVKFMWNDNAADNLPTKEIDQGGIYKLTVWNKNMCSASDEVTVTVNSRPIVNLGPDIWLCTGSTASLDATPGFSKYQWSNGAKSQKIDAGEGTYTVLVTDANGCVGGDVVQVSWHPVPNVDLGEDVYVCPLDKIVLDAGPGFSSYLWHDGSTSATFNAVVGDLHQVFVSDANGCYGMDSKYVLALSTPSLGIDSVQAVCDNIELVLDAGPGYNYYLWNDGSTNQTLVPQASGDFWVEVSDGCFIIKDSVQVSFFPSPLVVGVDSTFYKQLSIYADGGTKPYEYQLNGGSWQDESTFTNLPNGNHQFVIRDDNGCLAEFEIDYTSVLDISIPPIVTPNGDGYNDTWVIKGLERSPESRIRIYDRYGKMLANYRVGEPAWNGMYLGQPLPTDSYWYVIEIMPGNKLIKGFLTLKR